ncbi:hypothetical protein U1Q18_050147 [Sarracenia purpurea var. burkii]
MHYVIKNQKSIVIVKHQNGNADTKPSLGELMAKFQAAKDDKEAYDIFKKQCVLRYWSTIPSSILYEDNEELNEIARCVSSEDKINVIKLHGKTDRYEVLSPREFSFASDLFDVGTYFFTNLKRYEQCAEVFYFGHELFTKILKTTIERQMAKLGFRRSG